VTLPAPRVALPSTVPTRVEYPNNAVYDVVVVQPSGEDVGLLTGRPIYTVYLRLGTPKEWTLQYCVPNEAPQTTVSGSVVRVGSPAPVKAPYPSVTVLPPLETLSMTSKVTLHGFLDTSGKLLELKVMGDDRFKVKENVIPFLERWEFRPATRDGRPILVEILLLIPSMRA
jgi:hypothetical protein